MTLSQTSQFKKDIKRQKKRGKDLSKIQAVIEVLLAGQPLPIQHRDHPLLGAWRGRRDCHLEPDWILIHRLSKDELRLERTGLALGSVLNPDTRTGTVFVESSTTSIFTAVDQTIYTEVSPAPAELASMR